MIANNPLKLGGCLDSLSAESGPLCPDVRCLRRPADRAGRRAGLPAGCRPGVGRGRAPGAKLLHAFGEAVVPRVTLVTRKAYGGAYIAMNARSLGATRVFAWPGAEVAVMGPIAAVRILHRRKLAEVADDLRPQVEASRPPNTSASPAVWRRRWRSASWTRSWSRPAPAQLWPARSETQTLGRGGSAISPSES